MESFIKVIKYGAVIIATVGILASCSTPNKSPNARVSDGKNIFGVPMGTWDKLSPAEQKSIIKGYYMRRRRAAKQTYQQAKTTPDIQTPDQQSKIAHDAKTSDYSYQSITH